MVVKGTVTNGVVVLDPGAVVPEGTRVDVTILTSPGVDNPVTAASPLGERLMKLAGIANDLPSDMAAEHDVAGPEQRGQRQQEIWPVGEPAQRLREASVRR